MKIIITLMIGVFIGYFAHGVCVTANYCSPSIVYKAYSILVQAVNTGDVKEIANVAEEVIGYLGMALEG